LANRRLNLAVGHVELVYNPNSGQIDG